MVLIFDLDDTLINTSDLFWKVREEYLLLMKEVELPLTKIRNIFENQDTKNIRIFGYQPERYGKTMIDVYKSFVDAKKLKASEITERKIQDIGEKIIKNTPELISGSIDTLKKLKKEKHDLLLVTRGAIQTQTQKIEYHGLQKYFNEIFVVDHKDAQIFKNIIDSTGFGIEDSWIIGDSIKSDINPAIVLGVNCIHYNYKHEHYNWIQEHDEKPISENFYEISDIKMVNDVIHKHDFRAIVKTHNTASNYHQNKNKLRL